MLEKDTVINRHIEDLDSLKEIRDDFVDWLGETKYMHGLTTIPPSRFSNTNSNGLWEYSPFLCGVGLTEALELAYGVGLRIWDQIPEPMCLEHLHNMLVQKGYLARPVGLYLSLQKLFKASFFADGKIPTSDFIQAFSAVLGKTGTRQAIAHRQTVRMQVGRTATSWNELMTTSINWFFKTKSLLTTYRDADWIPDRIPDEALPVVSALGMLRIGQTKQIIDPVTGGKVLEDTELVKRARALGMDDATMMVMSPFFAKEKGRERIDLSTKIFCFSA